MKILLVTNEDPGFPVGGLSTFILGLKRGLLDLGLEVRILLIRYESSPTQKIPASDQVDYDIWGHHRFLSSSIDGQILEAAHSVLIQTLPILQDWKPDIIHCNDRQTFMPSMKPLCQWSIPVLCDKEYGTTSLLIQNWLWRPWASQGWHLLNNLKKDNSWSPILDDST